MAWQTSEDEWHCSVCVGEVQKCATLFGCRRCDYDECQSCYNKTMHDRPKWLEHYGNVAPYNLHVPSHSRKYFSDPGRMRQADNRKDLQQSTIPEAQLARPEWKSSVGSA